MNKIDLAAEAADLSAIYRELYMLATQTCRLPHEIADRWACWYCATGGHIEDQL